MGSLRGGRNFHSSIGTKREGQNVFFQGEKENANYLSFPDKPPGYRNAWGNEWEVDMLLEGMLAKCMLMG